MGCARVDGVDCPVAERVVVPFGVGLFDVVAVVLTKLDVRLVVVVVVDVVLDNVKSVGVVVSVGLPVVVVTGGSVVVTVGVTTVVAVVAAVVSAGGGSAGAGTIPLVSAVNVIAVPIAMTTAAPRQERIRNDALIAGSTPHRQRARCFTVPPNPLATGALVDWRHHRSIPSFTPSVTSSSLLVFYVAPSY